MIKINILLTNDDGIFSAGIKTLGETLAGNGHNVVIAAPDRERSASGHSITLNNPLRTSEIKTGYSNKNIKAYKINGTPADCVKLGLEKLTDDHIDLVISGINDGPNLGFDVLYSGTVSAAVEGYMMGKHSLAVSLLIKNNIDFISASLYILNFIKKMNFKKINQKLLLNINIPDLYSGNIKDTKITKLGKSMYEDVFEERVDPSGNKYYWMTDAGGRDDIDKECDIWTVKRGCVSITPLKLELTDYNLINILKQNL